MAGLFDPFALPVDSSFLAAVCRRKLAAKPRSSPITRASNATRTRGSRKNADCASSAAGAEPKQLWKPREYSVRFAYLSFAYLADGRWCRNELFP